MSDNITVAIKVRPLIKREIESNETIVWKIKDNTISPKGYNEQLYTFDHIFDQNASTEDVYNMVVDPVVTAAVNGIHGTIFAYGQTSSGKTYTMMGDKDEMGIIPLAVNHIFHQIENSDREFLLRVSYIEIYNEKINDLLNRKETDLRIHEGVNGEIIIKCKEECIRSSTQVLKLMNDGTKIRRIGETNMNERSSRSHTIFRIIIESRESNMASEKEAVPYKVSHLNLVDLAGSERANQTGATGARLKEGAHINKSLLALSLVIQQLSDGPPDPNKFINFRDSKLTRILQSSLGGNAKTSIICAVTPAALEETHSTLHFASKAKSIENKPVVNEVLSDETMMKRMAKQLDKLRNELAELKTEKTVNEETNLLLNNRIKLLEQSIIAGIKPPVESQRDRRRTWCGSSLQRNLNRIDEIPKPSVVLSTVDFSKINIHRGIKQESSSINDFSFKTPFEEFEINLLESERACRLSSVTECSDISDFQEISVFSKDQLSDSIDAKISEPYLGCENIHGNHDSPLKHFYRPGETPPCKLRERAFKISSELDELKSFTVLESAMYTEQEREIQEAKDEVQTLEFKLMQSEDKYLKLQDKLHEIDLLQEDLIDARKINRLLEGRLDVQLENESLLKKKLITLENENKDLIYLADVNKNKSKAREADLVNMIEEYQSKSFNMNISELSGKLFQSELSNKTLQGKLYEAEKVINENEVAYSAVVSENLCLRDQLLAHKNLKITMENDIKELRVGIETLKVELQYSTEKKALLNKLSQTDSSALDYNNSTCTFNYKSKSSSISSGFLETESVGDGALLSNSQPQISNMDNNALLKQMERINEELNEKQELILKSNDIIDSLQKELKNLREQLSEAESNVTLKFETEKLKTNFENSFTEFEGTEIEKYDEFVEEKIGINTEIEYRILKNGIDEIRSENECLKLEIEIKAEELNKAYDIQKQLKEELVLQNKKTKTLMTEIDKTSEDDSELRNASLIAVPSELNNKIVSLESELLEKDDVIKHLRNEVLSLQTDIKTVKGKLTSLKDEINMKDDIIDQLTIEKAELETDNDNFTAKHSKLSNDASQLQVEIAELETTVDNLKNEITRKQSQIDEGAAKYEELLIELNTLKQVIESKNESLELLNYEKMELQSYVSVAQTGLIKDETQHNFVTQEDFNVIENEKIKLENNYSNLIIELKKLQDEKAKYGLEDKINELNIKNNELHLSNEELKLNIKYSKTQIDAMESEKQILAVHAKQADNDILKLKNDNDKLLDEMSNISKSLNKNLVEMEQLRMEKEQLENSQKNYALIANGQISELKKAIDELKCDNLQLTTIANKTLCELVDTYKGLSSCAVLPEMQYRKNPLLNVSDESKNVDIIYLIQIIKETIEMTSQTALKLNVEKSQLLEQIKKINEENDDLKIRYNQSHKSLEEITSSRNYLLHEINSLHLNKVINTDDYTLIELIKLCIEFIINKQTDLLEELRHKLKKSEDWSAKLEVDIAELESINEEKSESYLEKIHNLEASNIDINKQNQLLQQRIEESDAEIMSLLTKVKDTSDSSHSLQIMDSVLAEYRSKLESAEKIQQEKDKEVLSQKNENKLLKQEYNQMVIDFDDMKVKHSLCSQNIDQLNDKLEKQFQIIKSSEKKNEEQARRLELFLAQKARILEDNEQLVRDKDSLNETIAELNKKILVRGEQVQGLKEELDIMKTENSSRHKRRSLGNDLTDIIADKELQIEELKKTYDNKFIEMQKEITSIQNEMDKLEYEKQELIGEMKLKESELVELRSKYDCLFSEAVITKNTFNNEKIEHQDRMKSVEDESNESDRRSCSPSANIMKVKTKRHSTHDSARNLDINFVDVFTMTDIDDSQRKIHQLEQQLTAEECKLTKLKLDYDCNIYTFEKGNKQLTQEVNTLTEKLSKLKKVNQQIMDSNKELEKSVNLSRKELELVSIKLENAIKERDTLQNRIKMDKGKISPVKSVETISIQSKSRRLSTHDLARNLTDDTAVEEANDISDDILKENQILKQTNKDLMESNKKISADNERLKIQCEELDKECDLLAEEIKSSDSRIAQLDNDNYTLKTEIENLTAARISPNLNLAGEAKSELSLSKKEVVDSSTMTEDEMCYKIADVNASEENALLKISIKDLTEISDKLKQENMSLQLKIKDLDKKCDASVSEIESERRAKSKILDDNNSLLARLRILDPTARLTPPKSTAKQNCTENVLTQSKSRRINIHDSARNLEEVSTSEKAIMADLDRNIIEDLQRQLDIKEYKIAKLEYEKPAITTPFIEKIEKLEKELGQSQSKCQQQSLQLRKYTNVLHNNTLISECYKCKGQRNQSFDDIKTGGVLKLSMNNVETQTDSPISSNVLKPVHQESSYTETAELYKKFQIQEKKKNQYKELSKMRGEEIKILQIQLNNKNKENNSDS